MDGEKPYVKLSEEQRQLQYIRPGELNEAINIDQLHGRTCEQCGQPLPTTYVPPADEEWMTGIFGCLEDTESCKNGLFCPCVLFGQNVASLNDEIPEQQACVSHAICVEGGMALAALTVALNGVIDPDTVCLLTEGLLFGWWVCAIYTGMGRQLLQRKYHLKDSPCDPCLVHCTLHWCALCQEHREMRRHLSERISSATTIVDPPEVQEMSAADQPDFPSSLLSQESAEHNNNMQLQQASRSSLSAERNNDMLLLPPSRSSLSTEHNNMQLQPPSPTPLISTERNSMQLQPDSPSSLISTEQDNMQLQPSSRSSLSAEPNSMQLQPASVRSLSAEPNSMQLQPASVSSLHRT